MKDFDLFPANAWVLIDLFGSKGVFAAGSEGLDPGEAYKAAGLCEPG